MESHATSSVNCADWGLLSLGATVWPLQSGYICSAFDGVVVSVPPVFTLPAKQFVGPGSVFVSAMSPLVGLPYPPLFVYVLLRIASPHGS